MLAAGFIGQFGKRLADYLVGRSRRRRERKLSSALPETTGGNTERDGSDGEKPELPDRVPVIQIPTALETPVATETVTEPTKAGFDSESPATSDLDAAAMAKVAKKVAKTQAKALKKSGS